MFHERRLELAMEGPNGYFDTQRDWTYLTGRILANMQLGQSTGFKTSRYPKANPFGSGPIPDKYRLMPIPQRALDINAKLKMRIALVSCFTNQPLANCRFSYSLDGERFISLGTPFTARQGRWVGATVGLFALRPGSARRAHADFDFFRIAPK